MDLITKLTLENNDFNQNLNSSTEAVKDFTKKTEDASDAVDELADSGKKSTKELLKAMGELDAGNRSISNYRRQLTQITKEIQDLTINYNNMTKEMQNSDLGHQVFDRIRELTIRAGEYKDAVSDAQQAITAMASDTASWDAIKMGVTTISSSMQAFAASGILGAKSTEKLVEVIAKLKAIEASTNAVIQIGTALQKQSALMTAVMRIQSAALTKAKTLEAAATGKATVAQAAFNAVASANPYVLLAAAVVAVVGAVAGFTLAMKNHNSETAKAKKIQEGYNKAINDGKVAAGESIAKFNLLRREYVDLKTEGEKTKWIEDNKDKFSELGIELNNINDAQKLLIDRADDFIRMLTLEAETAALMSYYTDEYKKGIEASIKAQDKLQKKVELTSRDIKKANLVYREDYIIETTPGSPMFGGGQSRTVLTESGRAKWEAYGKEVAKATDEGIEKGLTPVTDMLLEKQREAAQIKDSLGLTKKEDNSQKPTNPNKQQERDLVNELDILRKQLTELENEKKYIEFGTQEWKDQLVAIQAVTKEIEQLEAAEKGYLKRLEEAGKQKLPTMTEITGIAKADSPSTLLTPKITLNPQQLAEEYTNALQTAAQISDWTSIGIITTEKAVSMIKDINQYLQSIGIQVPVTLDTTKFSDDVKDFTSKMGGFIDTAGSLTTGINSIYESITSLSESLDSAESAWESFFAVINTGISILQSVSSIIEAVGNVTALFNSIKAAGIPLIAADARATREDARAHLKAAAAKGAEAAAEGGKSVANIPYVGPVLAVAAIATILGTIMTALSSAKGYANGGIIPGSNFAGDRNLIRANSGEMILNKKQQSKLWDIINGKDTSSSHPSGSQTVELKVRGTDLVAVLDNYNSKRNKI